MKVIPSVFLLITSLFLASCNNEKGIILSTPSRAAGSIIITSHEYNHLGITRYNLNGEFQEFITDYRGTTTNYPRGLALSNTPDSFMVVVDGEDRIETLDFNGNVTPFYGAPQLNGTLYDIVRGDGYYFVIEYDRIERFSFTGEHTTPLYINTITGACTLSTPRHLIINSQGYLVVVQSGADAILTYDVSSDTASCVSSVAFPNTPVGLVEHSDGNLYVVTQTNDSIYRADPDGSNPVIIWSSNTAIINNPNVIVEHPDGDLLIGANSTNTIEKIKTDGTRVGTEPFMKDVYTRQIYDILILDGSN